MEKICFEQSIKEYDVHQSYDGETYTAYTKKHQWYSVFVHKQPPCHPAERYYPEYDESSCKHQEKSHISYVFEPRNLIFKVKVITGEGS